MQRTSPACKHARVGSRALWGQPLMWPSAHPAWHLITALSVSHPAQWLHVLEFLSLQLLSSLYSITSSTSALLSSMQHSKLSWSRSGSPECWGHFFCSCAGVMLFVINVFLQYYSQKCHNIFSLDQLKLIIGPELCPGVLLLFASSSRFCDAVFSEEVPRRRSNVASLDDSSATLHSCMSGQS